MLSTEITVNQNRKLIELYKKTLSEVKKIVENKALKDISQLFVPQVREAYNAADNIKILYVGGETHKWSGTKEHGGYITIVDEECTIELCVDKMNNFLDFSKHYHNRRTPYWNFIHRISEGLNGTNNRYSYVWSNICKVDQLGTKPHKETRNALMPLFVDAFIEEVTILKPDVIVICAGPVYRDFLKDKLQINSYHLTEERNDNLEVINSELLQNPMKIYYSHHPRSLNKRENEINKLFRLTDIIIDDYNSKT